MGMKKKTIAAITDSRRLSLAPLSYEEAVRGLLAVKPAPKKPKKKPAKKK
jgi:hypothetical protein